MAGSFRHEEDPSLCYTTEDYVEAFRRAGITPQQVADVVGRLSSDAPRGGVNRGQASAHEPPEFSNDNIPGFEYLQRVTMAAGRAVVAQVERLNEDWVRIREGTYTFGAALGTTAKWLESVTHVVDEAWRGPSQFPRPAWLIIPYSLRHKPAPDLSVRVDAIFDRRMPLDYTKFEGLGSARSSQDIYAQAPHGVGNRVELRLNELTLERLDPNTDHVGFIFRPNAGPSPPLVIVVLRVAG